MKTIYLSVFFLGAYICGPGPLRAQESLLTKSIAGNSRIVYSVAFSPDGKYIASGGVDNTVKLWSFEDGSLVKEFKGHRNFVNSVAFSPDGKSLVSASEDGTVKLWSMESGACLGTLKGHKDSVWSAAFFPDGRRVVSGGTDGVIRIWGGDSKTPGRTIKGHSGYIYSVSITEDGKLLASAGAGRTIKIWDAETGAHKMTLEGHGSAVNSTAFSKNGEYLASGSDDGSVKVWRVSDGVCVKTFSAGQQPVLAVAYSPDGAYVFSGGGDRTINAWNIAKGVSARTFQGHNGSVKSLSFSADGKYLASGSFDKTIKIWLTPWEAEARNKEIQRAAAAEAENNKNYSLHYEAGLALLASPNPLKLKKAPEEFRLALSFKKSADGEEKLAEAVKAWGKKEQELRKLGSLGTAGLLVFFVIFTAWKVISGTKYKARLRETLPGEIKRETMMGGYENALRLYSKYKAIGGKKENLPQAELLDLFKGLQTLEELPKEDLPYTFFLSYADKFVKEGNFKMAQSMLRSGKLLDLFTKPGDYDEFVALYEEARRPENMLMIKLEPGTYTGLAEAFFKAKRYDCCEKVCGLKTQFHAKQVSARDKELLAASLKEKAA
ncbi:MAG: WD40 repeat domain-containing protein [Elusimicrobiales bacterium]|nr:WD40 repeat domain-containing protein [Elusimicrobiales bacterium]